MLHLAYYKFYLNIDTILFLYYNIRIFIELYYINLLIFRTLIHLEEYDDYYEYGCWGIVGLGGIVIICSIAGIYGGCAKKKCAVTCYSLGIMILFALFTGIGVMMIIFFQPFYNKIKDDTDCTDNDPKLDFINEANKMYLEAHDKYYCRQYTYEDPRFEEP